MSPIKPALKTSATNFNYFYSCASNSYRGPNNFDIINYKLSSRGLRTREPNLNQFEKDLPVRLMIIFGLVYSACEIAVWIELRVVVFFFSTLLYRISDGPLKSRPTIDRLHPHNVWQLYIFKYKLDLICLIMHIQTIDSYIICYISFVYITILAKRVVCRIESNFTQRHPQSFIHRIFF